jgi:predicted nucleotidyltransferase
MLGVNDPMLTRIIPRLAEVRGIVAVVLGGSRARGAASAASDYDIGLYFRSSRRRITGLDGLAKYRRAAGGWGARSAT